MGLLLLPFRINFSTECTSWSCYCPVWQEFFLASSYYFWVVPCVKLEKCFPFSCWTSKDFGSTLTHGKIPPLELLSFLYSHSHKLSLIPLPQPRVSVPSILCCQPGCAPKHFPTSSSHSLSTLPTLSYHSSSCLELCSHTSTEVHLFHFLILSSSVRMVRFSAAAFSHLKNFSNKS